MPDKSDRKFAFEVEKVPKSEYKTRYGYEPATLKEAQDALGSENVPDWQDEDCVVVANYWRITTETEPIYRMSDGQIVKDPDAYIAELQAQQAQQAAQQQAQMQPGMPGAPMMPPPMPPLPTVKDQRDMVERTVEWFCVDGMHAHSKGAWAGQYIPIVYTTCEQMKIDGAWKTKGMTFDGQDLTKANNYLLSAQIENIALTPKQPFVGPKGAFASDKAKWNNVNTGTYPFLEYDVIDAEGKPLPPPQRSTGVTAQPEIANVRLGVLDGQRAVVGLMGASMGDTGPEIAGIAIAARKSSGDTAVFHVMDNLVRAVRYCGMVIVDLIPEIYDAQRVVRIINPDGEPVMLAIQQAFPDPKAKDGVRVIDFGAGKYDITVSAGPAFETQRQSDNARLIDMAGKVPQLSQVAPDLLVKELLPGTNGDKIAQRLHRTLDPSITGEGPPPQVAQMQQQLQGLQQQMTELTQEKDFLASELAKQKSLVEAAQIKNHTASIDQQTKIAQLQGELQQSQLEIQKKEIEVQKAQLAVIRASMPAPVVPADHTAPPQFRN
jgi:hypothetical protein